MTDDDTFFREILDSEQHRPSGRAIIFDSSGRRLLVERNLGAREKYVAFPGGGIELGETLQECIAREMNEEIGAKVVSCEFLFLVENFMPFMGEVLHVLELFCEVKLESDVLEPQLADYEFPWIDGSRLEQVDLRPHVVRDRIVDGSFREVRHLISHK